MAYEVVVDPVAQAAIRALPGEALSALCGAMDVIGLVPWRADPINENNPGGAVRRIGFGPGDAGMIVFVIVEDARQVHVLQVHWLG